MQLRPYQQKAVDDIINAWHIVFNVLLVLATRGGKTVVIAHIIKRLQREHSCIIAHRQELLGQMSLTLAHNQIRHRIIAPVSVVRFIVQLHVEETGRSYYDPQALCSVAGVDTLLSKKRQEELAPWCRLVKYWIQDEAHHVLEDNKWGRAAALFPNAKGLGVTANTFRADGRGVGRYADGLFDLLVESISLRELIDTGFATKYRIFCPPAQNFDRKRLEREAVSKATGDIKPLALKKETRGSSIMGDVVEHYKRHAYKRLGVVFAPDIETASEIAASFNAEGIPAELLTGKTSDRVRIEVQKRFKKRDVWVLINVDLFGEGYDVPGIEYVGMARATMSFNLFCQQFARGLTLCDGKDEAIIVDHVGNCLHFAATYGMPDSRIEWSLDRREARSRGKRDPDLIPQRVCPACTQPYEAIYRDCPHCGSAHTPAERSKPEFVDGDLQELDLAALDALLQERKRVDRDPDSVRVGLEKSGRPYPIAKGAANRHRERQEAQSELRGALALWGGLQRHYQRPDSESYRRFYFRYGVDVLTAQTLGRPEALELKERINNDLIKGGVTV